MKKIHQIINQAELVYQEMDKFVYDKDNLPAAFQIQSTELLAFFSKIRGAILENGFIAAEHWEKKKVGDLVEVLKILLLHTLRNN